ncbi:MSMEG_4193 family putative phosphomutase [Nakamurella sp. YIM 132087]|uniref:MSMEG_4193 family putative phosphomutase n=1 Tax=Nakamurella alba TaxID=2665158 RepID=A0A7K1FIN2_9ACTN|nr:MSMEG_4193 family putative phosphomutase [Nakamurella alba]MTD13936.1 MSMEG_4193 family putative phosphomutase [Nakamurella alba]
MPTLVLLRHGRSTANTAGVLAGRSDGVSLDDHGTTQADGVPGRLATVTFDRLISSPLLRCWQTLAPLAAATGVPVEIDDRFAEVDYGDWTGRKLSELAKEPLWRTVQAQPSLAVFPGGEGLATVGTRAATAVRDVVRAAGEHDVLLVCSHGDVIKAILADALGLHLDGFQRIVVAPASISVIRYTPGRTFVERINDAGELGTLRPPPAAEKDPAAATTEAVANGNAPAPDGDAADRSSDAVVGGPAS